MEDTELAGCPVRKGDSVTVVIGSVNIDEADLEDADVVRFDRHTNRHVAFGAGVHRCLGSHLARLELRVAMGEWHRGSPSTGWKRAPAWCTPRAIRSVDHFPLVLVPAAGRPAPALPHRPAPAMVRSTRLPANVRNRTGQPETTRTERE